MKNSQNKIHIRPAWGIFIGQFDDNIMHKHYALQISIASQEQFTVTDENNTQTVCNTCFINSNIPHQFQSSEVSLIMLINPISSIGYQLYKRYQNASVIRADNDFKQLSNVFHAYLRNEISFDKFIVDAGEILANFKCAFDYENHLEDDRIYKAIQYLEQHFDRIVSLHEIASYCFLSETRFLHLFKEKTNLSFRRYQIWNKLIKSLPFLATNSITETAHQFGFTDSSHYNRSFKETFGLNPKILSQLN